MKRVLALACILLDAAPAVAAGRLGGGGSLDLSLTRILLSLFICLIVAVGAMLILKRHGGRISAAPLQAILKRNFPAARRIDVLESRRISPNADVCLIRCDEREYLLVCGPQGQMVLREGEARVRGGELRP